MKDAVCRKCRREGTKLFIKGARCNSAKCAFTKRSYPPGPHGKGKFVKISEYGKQLREKQKAKRIYSLREKQFYNYFKKASKNREATGEVLLQLLESRLDNIIYKLGFAHSRSQARQMITHGNVKVNGKKLAIPSYLVKPKDIIELKDKSKLDLAKTNVLSWLKFDKKDSKGEVIKLPDGEELPHDIDSQLIVEFYSR